MAGKARPWPWEPSAQGGRHQEDSKADLARARPYPTVSFELRPAMRFGVIQGEEMRAVADEVPQIY